MPNLISNTTTLSNDSLNRRVSEGIEETQSNLDLSGYKIQNSTFIHSVYQSCFDTYTRSGRSDPETFFRNLEDYVIFYQGVMEALQTDDPNTSIFRAVVILVKAQTGKSLHHNIRYVLAPAIAQTMHTVESHVSDFLQAVRNHFSSEPTNDIQSLETFVGNSRTAIDTVTMFKETAMYKKLYKLCFFLIASNLFESAGLTLENFGYSALEKRVMQKKFFLGPEFIVTIFDTVTFILQKGFQIYKTGDYDCIFHSGDSYTALYNRYQVLKTQSIQLHNPEQFGFKLSSFRSELEDVLEQFENISKHTYNMSHYDKNRIRTIVSDLWLIKTGLVTKKVARESRPCPFSLLVFGETAIGKSYIKDMLFHHFGNVKGLDTSKDFMHTRNPASEFWDGFQTFQWCLVMDDISFMNPNKCPNGDPTNLEFLQVINNLPFCPNQASLEDKGKTPFQGEFVIGTTNTEDLNAHHYFSHPSAVQRRFPFIIEPKLKPEYTGSDGMMDSDLLTYEEGKYTDAWTFNVKKVVPVSISSRKVKPDIIMVHENLNQRDFLVWFTTAIQAFDKKQKQMMKSVNTMQDIKMCKSCFLPSYYCECAAAIRNVSIQNFDCYNVGLTVAIVHFLTSVLFFLLMRAYFLSQFSLIPFRVRQCIRNRRRRFLAHYFPNRFNYWLDLGQNVRDNIGQPLLFTALLSVCASVYVLFKLNPRMRIQGYESSKVGTVPRADDKDTRKNVWYNDHYELSSFDFSAQSLSNAKRSMGEFSAMIGRQCVCIRTSLPTGDGKRVGRAVCLRGNVYMTNNHNIPELVKDTTIQVVSQSSKQGINENFSMTLSENQVIRYPDRDICIILLRCLPPKRGISSYIAPSALSGRYKGSFIKRESDGSLCVRDIPLSIKQLRANLPALDLVTDVWTSTVAIPTADGDCGALVLIDAPQAKCVAGIHVAGRGGSLVAIAITREECDKYVEHFPEFSCRASSPDLVTPNYERPIGALHDKSVFRFIESGTAGVHGSFIGFRQQPKSRVEVTPLAPHLTPLGYSVKFGRPVMTGWKPWNIALQDMVNPVSNIDNDHLEAVKASFIRDIKRGLSFEDFDLLGVLDDMTAINGAAGVNYVDKIPRNTSAGFPWKKSKKYFMTPGTPIGGLHDPVDIDPIIMDRVDVICQAYLDGERYCPVFTAHLKDEPVSFAKMEQGKTRVFTGAPMDFSIVVRKYLLSFVRLVQTKRYVFESAPGTIAQSLEWHEIAKFLTKFGKSRMIAGDYRKFDKKMSPLFMMAAFDIIIDLCEFSGKYSPEDIKIIRGIACDTSYPVIDFNGDLVQLFGSNPSGHPLTVIINGLVNCLYMRYAYYKLDPGETEDTFVDNVALITYGDDNAAGVSSKVPWYNHSSIASELGKLGIDYTMADKEAVSVPYIPFSQITFLKRTWMWNKEIGCYLAPLEHDSIEKMLMVWVKSKTISQEEQILAVVTSANREYFFYGREVYNKRQAILADVINKLELSMWVVPSTFPSWDQLCDEFRYNSRHVKL